jgi:hypothetical protein
MTTVKRSMKGGNPFKKPMSGGNPKKPMSGGSKTKKASKSSDGTAWCMQCKKKVSVHDGKVVPMKRKGGKTGKMLRGNCEKGHKVVKIVG